MCNISPQIKQHSLSLHGPQSKGQAGTTNKTICINKKLGLRAMVTTHNLTTPVTGL
jgi:hypothetical protein